MTRSDFSLLIRNLIRDAGLLEPVLEYEITDDNGKHILDVDLAWPSITKGWELDGLEFHFGRADVERDARTRMKVTSQGWQLQIVLWSMYRDEPEQLIENARRFLAA